MLELTIDKLPGGDATRRSTLVRISLTNTGQGTGGVKVYEVRVTHLEADGEPELAANACRTYREHGDGVLRLIHRALGRMLGDEKASSSIRE